MSQSKRIGKILFSDELRAELEGKLDVTGTLDWAQVTGKPQLSDASWKTPVNSSADLPLSGNNDGDIRLTLDTEKYVYVWDASLNQWLLIGANDTNIDWSAISGKPTTFPPTAHTHTEAQITNLDKYTKAEVNTFIASKANVAHQHTWQDLTNVPISFPPSSHSHSESDIINLDKYTKAEADLLFDAKANTSHTHTTAQVTGLDSALAGKASTTHTHTTAQVTGLDTALAGKAPTTHTHTASQITDLQSLLNAKVNTVVGKELTDNNYTDADKSKLDSLSASASVDYNTMYTAHQAHVNDSVIHVTQINKDTWNTVTNKADKTYVDTELSGKATTSSVTGHTGNSTIHVTQLEKDAWNASGSSDFSGNYADLIGTPLTFAPTAHAHSWADITGKPTTFPSTAHTHLWVDLTDKPTTFTPATHTHTTTQITGLDSALSNKVESSTYNGHTGNATIHTTQVEKDTWNNKANSIHNHKHFLVEDVRVDNAGDTHYDELPEYIENNAISSQFSMAFPGGANTWRSAISVKGWSGNYASWQISGTAHSTPDDNFYLRSGAGLAWRPWVKIWHDGNFDPATKANISHTHTTAQVTGLDTALAGKAPTTHTHTTSQVTGLDTALAGKAPTTHTHDDRYYTEAEVTTLVDEVRISVGTVQPTTDMWYKEI